MAFKDPFGLKIEYEGTEEEQTYLKNSMAEIKRTLARRARTDRHARRMLAQINEMEESDDYTVVIRAGNVTVGDYGETDPSGNTITIDFAAGAGKPDSYTPATLAHELGHAYAPHSPSVLLRVRTKENGVTWGNIYRRAYDMCQQPVNHETTRLWPSPSGNCYAYAP